MSFESWNFFFFYRMSEGDIEAVPPPPLSKEDEVELDEIKVKEDLLSPATPPPSTDSVDVQTLPQNGKKKKYNKSYFLI